MAKRGINAFIVGLSRAQKQTKHYTKSNVKTTVQLKTITRIDSTRLLFHLRVSTVLKSATEVST